MRSTSISGKRAITTYRPDTYQPGVPFRKRTEKPEPGGPDVRVIQSG